jgi:phage gpG-like protein
MTTFDSLDGLAKHLASLATSATGIGAALQVGLEKVAVTIEKEPKAEIGKYQPAVGPFPAWEPLSFTTLEGWGPFPGKIELGYAPPDNPLKRTGEMRESISHEVEPLVAIIGSTDRTMVFHEFGTSKMPARPVFGPAAFRNKETIQRLVGAAVVAGLVGGDVVHRALGYDFKTEEP